MEKQELVEKEDVAKYASISPNKKKKHLTNDQRENLIVFQRSWQRSQMLPYQ